jgi:hypothetical protein
MLLELKAQQVFVRLDLSGNSIGDAGTVAILIITANAQTPTRMLVSMHS